MTKDEKPEGPVVKGDQITNVIGEVGRWQIEKILIVFFAAAPGMKDTPRKAYLHYHHF